MSKITRPIITEVFPRKRLFGLLDRMRKRPVIWVSGPPGSGKTTLIASYLEARKLSCLWYQIDEGDQDPPTFFYYLGLAAKRVSPRMRKPLPLLTSEYLQGIPIFTQRYFENLSNCLKIPSVLAFDNYQEVALDSPFHEIILNGLSRVPEKINVILISRAEPPPSLIRLHANNFMNVLGWDELRLTQEESSALVKLRTKKKLQRETIQHLYNTTDGWAAGLVLMLEGVKRGVESKMLGRLTPGEIFDYFGKEIFDQTDKEIQEFFLKTAFLPKMTPKMAEALTELSYASRILSTLSRNNYFTERRFHTEPIYQYHPLFREFLLFRAKNTFPKEDLSVLCSRAATLLEEDGQTEAAISLLRDIGNWDGLVRLITKHAPSMLEQGRNRPLEEWLVNLPKDVIEKNPWLLYWIGLCRLPFDPLLARSFFEKAFEQFKTQENANGLFLAWSGIVESIWFDLSDFKLFDKWISVLEELMHDFDEFPSKEIGVRVASSMFIALVVRQPHHPDIEIWSDKTLAYLEYHTNISRKITTFFQQAFYRMFTGDYAKLGLAINSLRKLAQSRDVSPLAQLTTKFAETIYYRITGSNEKCLKAISDGLEISQRTGIRMLDRMFLFHGTLSAIGVNDGEKAKELLEKLEKSSTRSKPWDTSFYHLLKTRIALFQGDPEEAAIHADTALKFSMDVGSPLSLFMCHLVKCHVMHQMGKDREAAEHLAHTFHFANLVKSKNAKFFAFLAKTLFALDQGEEESCLLSLREALAIGKDGKYFDTYIDQPLAMARICAKALEAGIEVEYVQELIRRRNLIPEKASLRSENWPWPLKIYTLGRFELLKDGKPILFSRIAYDSFKTTLHRLRKLVGYEKAIQLHEGRLTLDEKFCWVDIWAFEHLLEEAEAKRNEGFIESAIQLTEKTIEIYKGTFLGKESEQPWMVSLHERLRSKFLESVEKLGRYWQESGKWGKALDCYLRGLEIDDLAEEFYQGLMACYLNLGQKAKALSVYNRCKRILSSTLGIEPSPKTVAIYRSLLSENRRDGDKAND